jgi:hypothetical protein
LGWVSTIFFSTTAKPPHPPRRRIVWQTIQFGQSAFNGSLRTSKQLGHILDPTMPEPSSLDGDIPSSIFLGQCFVKGPHVPNHFCFILRLKYESHPWLHSKNCETLHTLARSLSDILKNSDTY